MNGVHDMGGLQDMGPVQHEKDEPVFHAPWVYESFGHRRRWNWRTGVSLKIHNPYADGLVTLTSCPFKSGVTAMRLWMRAASAGKSMSIVQVIMPA